MRWRCLWFKYRHEVGPGREARVQAEADLARTEAETERYAELGRDLRRIRRQNHLAQAFLKAAGGDHR